MPKLIVQGRLKTALSAAFSSSSRIFSSAKYSTYSKEQLGIEENETGTWIEKLSDPQKVFAYGARNRLRITVALYTLNFRKPVNPEIISKAVKQLQSVFPPYQYTIRERDGDLWAYRPESVPIDVEVLPQGTPMPDAINHMTRPFDEVNGPLSRYGLVIADEDDPCLLPEIKKEFPYQCYIYETFHHSISDGTSHKLFVASMTDVLDAIIDGKDLSNAPPCGEFVSSEVYEGHYSQIKEELLKNPHRLEYLKDQILRSNKSPILLKGFSRPEVDEPATKHIFIDFDQDVYKKFIANCKKNGVSLGNAFQAVTNSSLVELVQDAGANDDSYDMSMMYSVDLRRYMKQKNLPSLGFHVRTLSSCITLEKNVRDNFWDNCRMIQHSNKNLLEGNSVFEQEVVRKHFLPYTAPEDFFKSPLPATRDFGYNNIGIVKLCGRNRHVMISYIDNLFQAHKFVYPFYNQIINYGGRLRKTISYANDWMTDDTANSFAEKIKSVVEYHSKR